MGKRVEEIYRQRLVIEGHYKGKITEKKIRDYLVGLSKHLSMTIVFGPRIMRRCEKINPKHKGFEAVMIWAESGVQLYEWEKQKFITIDIYCCHPFSSDRAAIYTGDILKFRIMSIKEV